MKAVSTKVRNETHRNKLKSLIAKGFPPAEKKMRLSVEVSAEGVRPLPQEEFDHHLVAMSLEMAKPAASRDRRNLRVLIKVSLPAHS